MDNRGAFLFILIALYLLVSSQVRAPLIDHDREHQRQVAEEQHALHLLNESRYGDFDPQAGRWLPVAGLRQNDSYSWNLLPDVQHRARRHLRFAFDKAGVQIPVALENPDEAPSVNLTQISLPVYHNVTGKLRGDWVRQKQDDAAASHRPHLNVTALVLENDYVTHDFGLNVTGDDGTLYLDLHEGDGEELLQEPSHVREIRADLAIESGSSLGNTWYMSLFGVHFPELGEVILTTTSEKFGGIFSLPHFALSQDTFDISHRLLVKSLSDTITEKQNSPPTFFPWSSLPHGSQSMAFPTPKCEYIIYLQQHPIMLHGNLAEPALLEQIEDELRFPMGAPIPSPPLMEMSAVIFSPDCGIVLETKGAPEYPPTESLYLVGPKQEEYSKYASRLVYAIAGVTVAQIFLLLRQIKEASTPSTRSRISFYTIAMMAIGDATVIIFTLLSLFSDTSFLVLTATAFLGFLSVSYIGMRFMMEIWAVQAPERREQDRRAPSQATNTNTRQEGQAPPVTAARAANSGATPTIILPPDQDEPEEELPMPNQTPAPRQSDNSGNDVGAMYARFYFILCCLLIISLWSLLWPNRVGAIYARLLGFIYLSFWVPQIYRNIMRNCRKALRWDFVIGQSILRLVPFVYFFTVRGNVLFIRPDSTTAFAMIGWVWFQVWVLASQDILGPRFFVPKGWAPPAYDYHPIIRDASASGSGEDLESGTTLPIGFLRAEERDAASNARDSDKPRPKDRKKKIFDCAICMQDIEVPVVTAPGGIAGASVADGASSILGRRAYMVTPCRHIFHSTCLESWMRLRLQCPICRESIPPV
ncbi:hypothetical protein VTN77DRAFT_9496 [Rasamsonia byssochlamydoides]|uniref:uncharacterized protein n=1 Tax=Rasamsonia byssochlamydoides TaxID=89139 RepID=UPI003743DFE7